MTARLDRAAGSIFEFGVVRPLLTLLAAVGVGSALGALRATWLLAQAEDIDITDDGGDLPSLLYGRWSA